MLAFLLAGVSIVPGAISSAKAQSDSANDRRIHVSGEATVTRLPDRVSVRFGIVRSAERPDEARRANADASEQALRAIRELGVPERSIRLERLQLHPEYRYTPEGGQEQIGYEVERMIAVQLDSLDLLPTLIARVVEQGANRLDQVQYELSEREEARNEALQRAVRDARERARHMAEAAGVSVGSVIRLGEQQVDVPRPVFQAEAMRAVEQSDGNPEAYAAGEIEITARVDAVFAIE